jgi:hypothetical protein
MTVLTQDVLDIISGFINTGFIKRFYDTNKHEIKLVLQLCKATYRKKRTLRKPKSMMFYYNSKNELVKKVSRRKFEWQTRTIHDAIIELA